MKVYSTLLIDDDPSLHKLLGQYLEDSDFQVLHAKSGIDGLKILFNRRPDLILLDVMMPRMDGWETCRRIRELTDVPIIFLTAKSDEPNRLAGFLGWGQMISSPNHSASRNWSPALKPFCAAPEKLYLPKLQAAPSCAVRLNLTKTGVK